jgi:hypothetical protein
MLLAIRKNYTPRDRPVHNTNDHKGHLYKNLHHHTDSSVPANSIRQLWYKLREYLRACHPYPCTAVAKSRDAGAWERELRDPGKQRLHFAAFERGDDA